MFLAALRRSHRFSPIHRESADDRTSITPLKTRPLRNPGQSSGRGDPEGHRRSGDITPFMAIARPLGRRGCRMARRVARTLPRQPWWFTIAALAATGWLAWRVHRVRGHVGRLRQGRDGERVVGQFLDGLREAGARIFHDVPG